MSSSPYLLLRILLGWSVVFLVFQIIYSAWEADITLDEPAHLALNKRLLDEGITERHSVHYYMSTTPALQSNIIVDRSIRSAFDIPQKHALFLARLFNLLWFLGVLAGVFIIARMAASTVLRLKQTWREEYETWRRRRLDQDRWVYIWVDGIYSGLRAEQRRLCALVVVGVNERGAKHFLAIEDGVRESTQSWREVLLDLKSRGLHAPELAVGDGAMGFWAALEEIYPHTRDQRCWLHKTVNVLNTSPKSVQPKAKRGLH